MIHSARKKRALVPGDESGGQGTLWPRPSFSWSRASGFFGGLNPGVGGRADAGSSRKNIPEGGSIGSNRIGGQDRSRGRRPLVPGVPRVLHTAAA